MAHFAFEGGVSTDPVDGAVEITVEQYQQAIQAVVSRKEVTIDGGFALRDPQPSKHHAWENGEWVDHTPEQEQEPQPEPPTPPLTARQLRLGLVINGFSLDQVTTTIDAIPDEQDRAVAKIEWEYASQFERDHPLIDQVGTALGLTSGQIDTMWEAALAL